MRRKKAVGSEPGHRGRIEEAEKSYRRMWSEIKPFVKAKKVRHYSTGGKWKVAAHEPQK